MANMFSDFIPITKTGAVNDAYIVSKSRQAVFIPAITMLQKTRTGES